MKFLAAIAAVCANSRDAFGAMRTQIYNEDIDYDMLP